MVVEKDMNQIWCCGRGMSLLFRLWMFCLMGKWNGGFEWVYIHDHDAEEKTEKAEYPSKPSHLGLWFLKLSCNDPSKRRRCGKKGWLGTHVSSLPFWAGDPSFSVQHPGILHNCHQPLQASLLHWITRAYNASGTQVVRHSSRETFLLAFVIPAAAALLPNRYWRSLSASTPKWGDRFGGVRLH